MARATTSYWDYIRVEELLALQSGLAPGDGELSDDEVRFIAIHQIDELWFKLVIRELESVRDVFRRDHVPETALAKACKALHRVGLIFELAGSHFRLMETMRTQDYLSFRDKLSPASGFQSAQMREIEILVGLDPEERVHMGYEGSFLDALKGEGGSSPAFERVQRRLADPVTVKDAVYAWLYRTPIEGSSPDSPDDAAVVEAFLAACYRCEEQSKQELIRSVAKAQALGGCEENQDTASEMPLVPASGGHGERVTPKESRALGEGDVARLEQRYAQELASSKRYLDAADVADAGERRRVQRMRAAILFIESNRDLPLLSWPGEIIDGLIAAEQSMLVFRQRHARMVERVIGRRTGTGGSAGVDYLDETARARVFKEIWAARTMLLAPQQAPHTQNRDFYGLRIE